MPQSRRPSAPTIADRVSSDRSLAALEFVRGRPRLAPGFTAEHEGVRRYRDMRPVAAVPPGRAGPRVLYWSFAGIADDAHRDLIRGLPVSYDITVMSTRPMGWERPKTHGHVHTSRTGPRTGFPELYEVLRGEAGFLVQDLHAGPRATLAALIHATGGDTVVIPPGLHHVTVNLGDTELVVADVVCRESGDDYTQLRSAGGMAYYIDTDNGARVNPAYVDVPPLRRVTAAEWSGPAEATTYSLLIGEAHGYEWLCAPVSATAR